MVTPSYDPIIGGTETFVNQVTHKLNEIKIDTDIMTFNMNCKWSPFKGDQIRIEDGFRVWRASASNPRIFNFRGHTPYRELLNVHVIPKLGFSKIFAKYDIIHFHDDIDLSFPLFSYFIGTQKKPRLLHCHSLNHTYHSYRTNSLSRSFLRKVADIYVGLSTSSIGLLLNLGLPKSKLKILPNAVDTTVFRPNASKKFDNQILSVGRLSREKGIDVLLRALFHLDIPTRVLIIGPVGDRLYFEEIKSLIQKVNSETSHKAVHVGLVDKATLIRQYQEASLFVCPSISEPFGIVNIEALACGTPVIATNVGGIPDIVKDRVNGLLVPANRPLAIALALQELLSDRKSRERYGKRGRQIIQNSFSWNVVLEKLLKIYQGLLEAQP